MPEAYTTPNDFRTFAALARAGAALHEAWGHMCDAAAVAGTDHPVSVRIVEAGHDLDALTEKLTAIGKTIEGAR